VERLPLVIVFAIFPAVAAMARRWLPPQRHALALAVVNLVGLAPLCVLTGLKMGVGLSELRSFLSLAAACYGAYVVVVLVAFVLTKRLARASGAWPWIAFSFPIATMLVVKYVPASWLGAQISRGGQVGLPEFFIGISYMAFRLSRLVLEVRNGATEPPSLSEYLSFAFLLPTLTVGPISSYKTHARSLHETGEALPKSTALVRIAVGLCKFIVFGSLLGQLSYGAFLRDGHPHGGFDLIIAVVAYYLHLYCNFSGYCDIAIGAAGLAGLSIEENFGSPFRARNVREFWNEWHITLSTYLRDVLFTPISTALIRRYGPRSTNHAIAIASSSVFVLMGLWHGIAWNFFLFGLSHAVAVAATHYYAFFLKRRLGKKGFEAYTSHRGIRGVAVALTFSYVAATLFLFANTMHQASDILKAVTR
jgi:D-alanyl-lipoteichoic acid acyltransferase DltB (MBOAT superfamily)